MWLPVGVVSAVVTESTAVPLGMTVAGLTSQTAPTGSPPTTSVTGLGSPIVPTTPTV